MILQIPESFIIIIFIRSLKAIRKYQISKISKISKIPDISENGGEKFLIKLDTYQ